MERLAARAGDAAEDPTAARIAATEASTALRDAELLVDTLDTLTAGLQATETHHRRSLESADRARDEATATELRATALRTELARCDEQLAARLGARRRTR